MMKLKSISILAVFALLFLGTSSFAVVAQKSGTGTGLSPSQTEILKVTGVVKKIEKNVLYLENGTKYDLNGVKATYSKGRPVSPSKKRIAEMFFVDGVLKEVTIR
jgi:hypothetical protein